LYFSYVEIEYVPTKKYKFFSCQKRDRCKAVNDFAGTCLKICRRILNFAGVAFEAKVAPAKDPRQQNSAGARQKILSLWHAPENTYNTVTPTCTVRLTSIYHPQIGGKFTATPVVLTNIFYGCIV
jgi:hypothetical protein